MSRKFNIAYRFRAKLVLGGALTALADWLFFGETAGWTVGAYATLALICTAGCNRRLRQGPLAGSLLAAAFSLAVILAWRPSFLALGIFSLTLLTALLMPRAPSPFNVVRVLALIPGFAIAATLNPIRTLIRWHAARGWRHARTTGLSWSDLIAPSLGAALFIALFAAANPVIATVISRLDVGNGDIVASLFRLGSWALIFTALWAILRPWRMRVPNRADKPGLRMPWLTNASLCLSLLVFNVVFAGENALDVAFLWSGAKLPPGVTYASYAHRGAYPLILTALLAGAFVLLTFPATKERTQPSLTINWLVFIWIAQNVFLVASSVLRTAAYVGAYGLTELRLAAFAWMFLVALGLVLIFLRIALRRSSVWLINANALAVFLVLACACFADSGAIVASWDIMHCDLMGGRLTIDLGYVRSLGTSALIPLARAETANPYARRAFGETYQEAYEQVAAAQRDWHSWTPLGAWRLSTADRILRGYQAEAGQK